MNKSVLGIDLGTSSVKILQRYEDGTVIKSKAGYDMITPEGWWNALCLALTNINLSDVIAIGLSSQVGTYIIDEKEVISWNARIGGKELEEIKKKYKEDIFIEEISMPHPNIVSYPIPRLQYIKEHYPNARKIGQPKDFICERLTGNFVTDPYSWRGLANLNTGKYSAFFLNVIGVKEECLPKILNYMELAGYTRETALTKGVLPAGIPVFVGLNDYFASLLGMGIQNTGDMFDITGTSEHLGVIEEALNKETKLVSGPYLREGASWADMSSSQFDVAHKNENPAKDISPYLQRYVHYGVTASSGVSLNLGLEFWENGEVNLKKVRDRQPPIFLPYLNGERAPVWDADAKGTFFGISAGCTREDMAYAVLEGVVFSLYHIYEKMGKPKTTKMTVTGGAAVNPVLNRLKAELFGVTVAVTKEKDTSALGAAMIAAAGAGWYVTLSKAADDFCGTKEIIEPTGEYKQWLKKRFEIYKELYPALKQSFRRWKEVRK